MFSSWLTYVAAALGLVLLALALWWLLPGPRRLRTFRRAQRELQQGQWHTALALFRGLDRPQLSDSWRQSLRKAESDCHRAAVSGALGEKNFETALEHALKANAVLGKPEAQARTWIVDVMLEEVRRLFSASSATAAVHQLIGRILLIQNPCLEASFWQGLCHIRDGQVERGMAALQTARTGAGGLNLNELDPEQAAVASRSAFIDPPLYLGALYLRQGQPKEALRYLTEANRVDGNCPFVLGQLGGAMLAAGGDTQLAVRALQRAVGARGLGQWREKPQRAWVEAFPPTLSYVRRLAEKHPYPCPLWGGDAQLALRQAQISLGQGLYRLGQYRESAEVFGKLMQEAAPTLPLLRGYGLALARIGNYDEAFKHLRAAHELEETDRQAAGYLALCGAKGKPAQEQDKPRNVLWAIRLVSEFTAPGDVEWANLVSAIFAEARTLGLSIERDDQLYLCEHLLSVSATDPQAAEAYHHLQATFPRVVTREYAWLYCRAAQQYGVTGPHALELFARTLSDPAAAREFYDKHQWNFDDIEVTYLERAAELRPGVFPPELGADYGPRGEESLLARSRQQEQAKQLDAARATVQTLLKLAPQSARAHDRLAYLHHRQGNLAAAAQVLQAWSAIHPRDPLPLVRQAMVYQQQGEPARCQETLRDALGLAQGKQRADIAALGARLALASALPHALGKPEAAELLQNARTFLEDALSHDPANAEALWLLAAVREILGDRAALAQQAAAMDRGEIADSRFHYLAGVCHLASGNHVAAKDACQRVERLREAAPVTEGAVAAFSLAEECAYLEGWAHIQAQNAMAAAQALAMPAKSAASPSAGHARALLGKLAFDAGREDEAIRCWKEVDPKRRAAWKLNETLAGTVFLTALQAYQDGEYEKAAAAIREAGRLGWRDRRLGSLLTLALVKAGQTYLYNPMAVIGSEA